MKINTIARTKWGVYKIYYVIIFPLEILKELIFIMCLKRRFCRTMITVGLKALLRDFVGLLFTLINSLTNRDFTRLVSIGIFLTWLNNILIYLNDLIVILFFIILLKWLRISCSLIIIFLTFMNLIEEYLLKKKKHSCSIKREYTWQTRVAFFVKARFAYFQELFEKPLSFYV